MGQEQSERDRMRVKTVSDVGGNRSADSKLSGYPGYPVDVSAVCLESRQKGGIPRNLERQSTLNVAQA
jgi:hypothetical protein